MASTWGCCGLGIGALTRKGSNPHWDVVSNIMIVRELVAVFSFEEPRVRHRGPRGQESTVSCREACPGFVGATLKLVRVANRLYGMRLRELVGGCPETELRVRSRGGHNTCVGIQGVTMQSVIIVREVLEGSICWEPRVRSVRGPGLCVDILGELGRPAGWKPGTWLCTDRIGGLGSWVALWGPC